MPKRDFPNPVANFGNRLFFTTLEDKQAQSHSREAFTDPVNSRRCHLFSLDDAMRYTPFAGDFGPYNLLYTFQACKAIHEMMNDKLYRYKPIVLYCSPKTTVKSNMVLMMALYAVICEEATPSDAMRPLMDFEVRPFRDAGAGIFDWGLQHQDIVNGVFKAINNHLLDVSDFCPQTYTYYEKPSNGDLNFLGPFIPFASPMESEYILARQIATMRDPSIRDQLDDDKFSPKAKLQSLSHGFRCVLDVFEEDNVGVVVRLNDPLYDRRHFTDRGIDHVDMYFDDGSNPSDEITRDFIALAEHTIEKRKKKVAVHCKAGLGRTGVLIGAYLIYRYRFTAQEAIGYMRIVRPGMVVGTQQQYMAENQLKWAGWAAHDQLKREMALQRAEGEGYNPLATPPAEEVIQLPSSEVRRSTATSGYLARTPELETPRQPARETMALVSASKDAVGQPRKTPMGPRVVGAGSNFDYVEILTPECSHAELPSPLAPAAEIIPDVRNRATTPRFVSGSSTASSSRGVKRGANTLSVPVASTPGSLSPPPYAITRASSNSSLRSPNDRPTKRRVPSGSNSGVAGLGLGNPPRTRSSTPSNSDKLPDKAIRPIPPVPTSSASRIPPPTTPRLRKTPSAKNIRPKTPTRSTFVSPPPEPMPTSLSHTVSSAGGTPRATRRNLLPSRKPLPLQDLQLPQTLLTATSTTPATKIPSPPPKAMLAGRRDVKLAGSTTGGVNAAQRFGINVFARLAGNSQAW